MAVQIQIRRGTTSEWSSANPVLASGELGLNTTTGQLKVGNGSTAWNSLSYVNFASTTLSITDFSAKGDLLAGASASGYTKVTVGSNNSILVADSAQTGGIKWASTLSGLTLTSPTINGATVTGSVTLPSNLSLTTPTLTTPTVTAASVTGASTVTNAKLVASREGWTVGTAPTSTTTLSVDTSSNFLYTSNATTNWTFNFTATSGMNTFLNTGESVTVTAVVTNGSTAYYATAFQVEGSSVTPKWQGNAAPNAGNASGLDAYTFTIVKTAANTYTVLAAQTKFA